MTVDKKWIQRLVKEYSKEQPIYKVYAEVLRNVLEKACRIHAPMGIVEVRAKSLSSFAQKSVRKADKYPDPIRQMTDLCGARVITFTREESDRICRFIREHFRIDEANSEDARGCLGTGEFGYMSVHFIVQLRSDRVLGVDLRKRRIGERKAEIQVRTLLQHAWAAMAHDRFYKSEFKVPKPLEREMARVAALLEEGDNEFSRVFGALDLYEMHYGFHLKKKDREKEMERWVSILENEQDEKNMPAVALRIARLAKISGDLDAVIARLAPIEKTVEGRKNAAVLLELGDALCRKHRSRPWSREYRNGQKMLESVARPEEIRLDDPAPRPIERDETRAHALYALAWSYRNDPGKEKTARDLYDKAYRCDPANPYHFASFIEYQIYLARNRGFVPMLRPAMNKAVDACRAHAEAGIELPWAFLTMGRFHLLMGQPYESLASYAKAIHLCLGEELCTPEDVFDGELEFLENINFGLEFPHEEQWVKEMLLLAKAVRSGNKRGPVKVRREAIRGKEFQRPVVIVAGGADVAFQKEMEQYENFLMKTFEGFPGTVISGGTTAGIPGIVGTLAERLRGRAGSPAVFLGYHPRSLPAHVKLDHRYDELVKTEGNDFTPLQPLRNWKDLFAAGVKPSEVCVLGINGGRIAAFEYHLALALGATVGIVESSERAATDLLSDPDWRDAGNLLRLPCDPMTARAFVCPGGMSLSPAQLEKIGRNSHNEFLKKERWKRLDPVMMPWDRLREDLKHSNIHQAAYIEEIVGQVGYKILPAKKRKGVQKFSDREVEIMSEMEHGRWVVERLRSGWKCGPKKDAERRVSPFLRPWNELTEEVKRWDRENVRNFPKVLAVAGLGIYRKKGK